MSGVIDDVLQPTGWLVDGLGPGGSLADVQSVGEVNDVLTVDGWTTSLEVSTLLQLIANAPLTQPGTAFTRASTATVPDYAGVLHTTLSGELRIANARRVENLRPSNDIQQSTGFVTNTTIVDSRTVTLSSANGSIFSLRIPSAPTYAAGIKFFARFMLACPAGSRTITARFNTTTGVDDTRLSVAVGPTPVLVEMELTLTGPYQIECGIDNRSLMGTGADTSAGTFTIDDLQIEIAAEGQTEPSEFVSRGASITDGVELMTDGGFDDPSQWTVLNANGDVSGGKINHTVNSVNYYVANTFTLIPGNVYKITWDHVSSGGGANTRIYTDSSATVVSPTLESGYFGGVGSFQFIFTATKKYIGFYCVNPVDIDNASIQRLVHHGAGVDGVKYFDTYPPWHAQAGQKLPGPIGYLREPASTNLFLNSDTLATQSVTLTNATAYTMSFYGDGSVQLSGADATNVVGTAGERTTHTFTSASTSLTATVTGSVLNAQIELGNSATTYIPTTGVAGVRLAGSLNWTHGIADFDTEGTAIVHFVPNMAMPQTAESFLIGSAATNRGASFHPTVQRRLTGNDGVNAVVLTGSTPFDGEIHRAALSWGTSGMIVSLDGDSITGSFDGVMDSFATTEIGKGTFSGIITHAELR